MSQQPRQHQKHFNPKKRLRPSSEQQERRPSEAEIKLAKLLGKGRK